MKSFRLVAALAASLTPAFAAQKQQLPFVNDVAYNPASASALPSLNDLLVINQDISIFASYLRESSYLSRRLLTPAIKTTIFSPTNNAIMSLSQPPHKGPSSEETIETQDGEKGLAKYLEDWVSGYIVAGEAELFNDDKKTLELDTLASDRTMYLERTSQEGEDWQQVSLNQTMHISRRYEASDGILYVIDGEIKD